MMKKPLFSGVCTALVTPFADNRINKSLLYKLLDRQMEAGIRTIVISGTTGESPTLSDEEKLILFRRCKEHTGKDCRILAGTGSNNTAHAVQLSVQAEEAGVDGLLVVSPYYNKATAEGLLLHYSAIAESVDIPLILYNVPSRTGVDIPVSTYEDLSRLPNIAGVKEASRDITKFARIMAECPPEFSLWSGNDDMIVPVMSLGGSGVISVLSNILPKETVSMTQAALEGDYKSAAEIQQQLLPLIDCLFSEVNPIPVKAAMKLKGLDCGECRLPLTPLSQRNYEVLKILLEK